MNAKNYVNEIKLGFIFLIFDFHYPINKSSYIYYNWNLSKLCFQLSSYIQNRFFKHQFIGNVIEQAKRLNDYNVDELVYIDITRNNHYDLGRDDLLVKSKGDIITIIKDISKVCFMPLTFGGKIRNVNDAVSRIRAGADKIIINSLLLKEIFFWKSA